MINFVIIIIILTGLTLHRYLTMFYEQGGLPYSMGFLIYANIFMAIYTAHFIWMFGILGGIVVALLALFQVIYSAYLWIFLLPSLNSMLKKTFLAELPKVNLVAYSTWAFVVVLLGILLIINFFVSDYKSALMVTWDLIDYEYISFWVVFIGSLILGNFMRTIILAKRLKS